MILFEKVIKSEFTYGSSIILDNVFELISWKYSVIHEQKCKKNSELLLWISNFQFNKRRLQLFIEFEWKFNF